MINKKLNPECGIRLKQCISHARMTQKELSNMSGYTQQYISNIVRGKRNLSLEASRIFSKILKVDEKFLLCETNYKNDFDSSISRIRSRDQLRALSLQLLNLCGYSLVCDFIGNWDFLGLENFIVDNDSSKALAKAPSEISRQAEYLTEIIAPNGKHFYCDTDDIELLHCELIEFIHLRMKQLESKYALRFDFGRIFQRKEGRELEFYDNQLPKDSFDNPSHLERYWINHDDDFFADITNSADF